MSAHRFSIALWIALVCVPSQVWANRSAGDELGELDDDDPDQGDESTDDEGEANAEDEEASDAPATAPAEEPAGPSIAIAPFAGAGIATRSYQRPVSFGTQRLDAAAVPGVEVGLQVTAWPSADFSLVFSLVYQSALWFTVTERPLFALPNQVSARSERIALDLAPSWRFGVFRLTIPVGVTVRSLWPEVHTLMTAGYSLIGPHARLDLALQISSALRLRIAPELHWITGIDEALVDSGVSSQGIALGGEASVDLQLSSVWGLGIHYRESHAVIGTTRDSQFTDIERYLTLRLTGTF